MVASVMLHSGADEAPVSTVKVVGDIDGCIDVEGKVLISLFRIN
jgi:hypothetical protein